MKQTYFYFLFALVSFQGLSAQVLDATISIDAGNHLVITINSDASFQFNQSHIGVPSLVIEDVYAVDVTTSLTTSVNGGSGISFTSSNGNTGTANQMGPFGLNFGIYSLRDDEITFTEPVQNFTPGDVITIKAGTIISLATFNNPVPAINPGPYNAFIASDDYFSIAATQIVLPVELTEFSGRETADEVYLNWQTASETNNKGFQIEHATDGMNWESIGFVGGEGTISAFSNYEFIHKRPATGANYYRLKQIDYDDSYTYSKVITLEFTTPGAFTLKPNPTSGIIKLEGIQEGIITILDASGRVLKKQILSGPEIDVSELPAGLLFLQVSSGDKSVTRRVVKQ